MRRLIRPLGFALALATGLTACAVNLGGPRNIPLTTVALRADADADANAVGAALSARETDIALVIGPPDSAWFAAATAAAGEDGLTLSGPATVGDLGFGFLAGEPLADTTVVIPFDEGSLTVRDALYDVGDERFLDLLALEIDDPTTAEAAMRAFLEYVAADVMNSAAVIIAVAVPSAALGDQVERMLGPAYFDALRCDPGLSTSTERSDIRLFYGPEARMYCTDAAPEAVPFGKLIRADLVLGRR